MSKNFLTGVTVSILMILMSGCAVLRESRIPDFIEELDQHEFSFSERQTIGKLLKYINELENL